MVSKTMWSPSKPSLLLTLFALSTFASPVAPTEFTSPRTLILGRSTQTDVQIYDERISRRHCAIRLDT